MALYKICQYCGSNLDYGERCDCKQPRDDPKGRIAKILRKQNPLLHDLMANEKPIQH